MGWRGKEGCGSSKGWRKCDSYLCICVSFYLSVCVSFYVSSCLNESVIRIYLRVFLCVQLSNEGVIVTYVCMCVHPSIHPAIYLDAILIYVSIYLPVYQAISPGIEMKV